MRPYIDLTGQTFGRLTVLRRKVLPRNQRRSAVWICRCQCGQRTEVTGSHLRRGDTQSCGCLRRPNLVGQTFGRLTVIRWSGKPRQPARWQCRCQCGQVVVVRANALLTGNTRSCGCLQREAITRRFRRDRTGQTYGWLTVLGPAIKRPKADGVWCWLCRCRCGRTVEVRGRSLASGNTTSCGCKSAAKRRNVPTRDGLRGGTGAAVAR